MRISSTFWVVLHLFGFALLALALGFHSTRGGFDAASASIGKGIAAAAAAGASVIGWLGLTSVYTDGPKSALRTLLTHWAGATWVFVLLAGCAAWLFWSASGRVKVWFACSPPGTKLEVAGNLEKCDTPMWVALPVEYEARAESFESVSAVLEAAEENHGRVEVQLKKETQWRCTLDRIEEGGPMDGCGMPGSWKTARTYALSIEGPRDGQRLAARVLPDYDGLVGVAIQSAGLDCATDMDPGKPGGLSRQLLNALCKQDGAWIVPLTLCAAVADLSGDLATMAKLLIMSNDGQGVELICAPPAPGAAP